MNKILEKLGLYDLTVLLLTGMIISTLTIIVLKYVFNFAEIDELLETGGTVLFLVLSYFVGLVFQEIGSIFQKHIIHKNNGVLKRALSTFDNPHCLLSETEKSKIIDFVKGKLDMSETQCKEAAIYNYCKASLMKNGDMTKAERDQYISGMSRSLSMYFGFIFISTLLKTILKFDVIALIVTGVSAFLCLLLYQRSVRLAVMRYAYIFKAFYYQVVLECEL